MNIMFPGGFRKFQSYLLKLHGYPNLNLGKVVLLSMLFSF